MLALPERYKKRKKEGGGGGEERKEGIKERSKKNGIDQ